MEGMEIMNTVDQWFKSCHEIQLLDTYAVFDLWEEQTDQLEAGEALMRIAKMAEEFGLVGLIRLLQHYCNTVRLTTEGNRKIHLLLYFLSTHLSGLAGMLEFAVGEVESGGQELKERLSNQTEGRTA